ILFRGRPAGSFDALNRARAKGGRRVFLKHALAEWRIWKGPRDFFAGYRSRLIHLFIYFHEGAKAHAAAGRYGAALRGTLDAAYIFPARATLRFVFPSALRKSLKAIVRPGGAKSQKSNSQAPNSQAPKQSGQT
ncbi:MAG TPA: hypothetical protein VG942_06160, partial [Hyphomonadaceae bacterium]|nr:hypothetical protein [Hyphomonadaceae bacterium]